MSEARLRQGLRAHARSLGKRRRKGERGNRAGRRGGKRRDEECWSGAQGERRKTQRHDMREMSEFPAGAEGARVSDRMRAAQRRAKGMPLTHHRAEVREVKARECRSFRDSSADVMGKSHCRRRLPNMLHSERERRSGSTETGEGRSRHGRNGALLRAEPLPGPVRFGERQPVSRQGRRVFFERAPTVCRRFFAFFWGRGPRFPGSTR